MVAQAGRSLSPLGVVLLVQIGMPGAGLVWLSMVPVVAAVLLGMRGAIVALSIMAGTVVLFGVGIAAGWLRWTAGPGHLADGQDLMVWFVNASNALLLSAAAAGWLADRKGYGERLGLAFGLLLTVVGVLIVLLLPGRPGSRWKEEGPLPRRH